jgi:HEPN domain-containing protein
VHKAEGDLRAARALRNVEPTLHSQICFECQQSAEKYLKALLQESGLPVPRTHNLVDLLKLLVPHDAGLKALVAGLGFPHAIRRRVSVSRGECERTASPGCHALGRTIGAGDPFAAEVSAIGTGLKRERIG